MRLRLRSRWRRGRSILAALGNSADEIARLNAGRAVLRSERMLNTEKREG